MFSIYCITNVLNNKKYYGQTVKTLKERWCEHLCAVRRGNRCYHLQNAIKKYGEHNFKIELIEEVVTKQAANEREIYYINRDNTFEDGYNLTKGGDGSVGRKDSEETKTKRNASLKETLKDGFSDEHKEKLSKAKKGKPGPNIGKKFTEEHKENLRKSHLGNSSREGTGKLAIYVEDIKNMYRSGISQKKIATEFETTQSAISRIINKKEKH